MKLGTVIDGRYVTVSHHSTGKFSEVDRGTTLGDIPRDVAIKLLKEKVDDHLFREVFEREVAALKDLRHPNVIELLHAGLTEERYPFIVTEYCNNPLASIGKWDVGVVDVASALLEALQNAHALGIIHRDLKPQHLLRPSPGAAIKVIDFGIASIRGRLATGVTLASHYTPGYACEDQMRGRQPRAQFDLYATSACLLWYLTGSDPNPELELEEQIRSSPVRMPTAFRDFLILLTQTGNDALTAGVALRELQRISANWRVTEEHCLLVPHEMLRKLTEFWDLRSDDQAGVLARIDQDLAPDGSNYPAVAVEESARDPEAFQQYRYRIIGKQYVWRVTVHSGGRAFLLQDIREPSSEELEGHRMTGFEQLIDWLPVVPGRVSPDAKPVQSVCRRIIDLELDKAAEKASNRGRWELVEKWDSVFRLQRQLLNDPAATAEYSGWSDEREHIRVSLQSGEERTALWAPGERISMTGRHQRGFVSVGHLVERVQNTILLRPDLGRSLPELAPSGRIAPDRMLEYAAIRRQQNALYSIKKGTAANPSLPSILCSAAPPKPIEGAHVDVWFNSQLDETKRRAIELGLGTTDILLVQGPPGTGKTAAIAELVLQILSSAPSARVLLASQSHVALDQALDRIVDSDPDVSLVRLARSEDKVSPSARSWLLNQRVTLWRDAVLERSRQYLDSIGLDPSRELPSANALDLLDEADGYDKRLEELRRTRMTPLSRLSALRRSASEGTDEERVVREELDAIDEEIRNIQDNRGIATELVKDFLEAHSVSTDGSSVDWRERLTAIGASQALDPKSRLAAVWDNWKRQFGRGLPYEAALAKRRRVLAGTCLGAGGHPAVENSEFDWVIVDEAGRATAPEILVPLVRGHRAILVGDHHQLPPVVDRDIPDAELELLDLSRADLETSLFESLFKSLPEANKVMLAVQYRMHPAIGTMISDVFYAGDVENGPVEFPYVPSWPTAPVTWFSTSRQNDRHESKLGTSFMNSAEVRMARTVLLKWRDIARDAGVSPTVGVITAYEEQRRALDREIDPSNLDHWRPLSVEVNTVDSFQGRERDLVIYSAVRSNEKAEIGFLGDIRRLNVALSRGRCKLVILGDEQMLRLATGVKGDNPFRRVIDWIRSRKEDAILLHSID